MAKKTQDDYRDELQRPDFSPTRPRTPKSPPLQQLYVDGQQPPVDYASVAQARSGPTKKEHAGTIFAPADQAPTQSQALQASGPTQTGYLNFDRYYSANQGAAEAGAKRVREQVRAQAEKAKQGVRDTHNSYMQALGQSGTGIGYDAQGNWMGGAAGPQVPQYQASPLGTGILSPDGNDFAEEGQQQLSESQVAADDERYRQQLLGAQADALARKQGIGDFTDTMGYDEALAGAKSADEALGLLGNEAGLATLSGGSWADAALLGQAGRPDFAKLQKDYSKKGDLLADGLEEYLGQFADSDAEYAQQARDALDYEAAVYGDELNYFNHLKDKEAADKAAAEEAKKNAPKSFDDLVKYGEQQGRSLTWDDVGKRGATNNARKLAYWKGNQLGGPGQDAWMLAEKIMKPAGLEGDAASKYWDEFRNSLPEGLRNWINGMVAWDGEMGEQNAQSNSDADWQYFQELFSAYMKKNPPKKG